LLPAASLHLTLVLALSYPQHTSSAPPDPCPCELSGLFWLTASRGPGPDLQSKLAKTKKQKNLAERFCFVCRPRFSSGFGRKRTVGSRGKKTPVVVVDCCCNANEQAEAAMQFTLSVSLSPRKRALVGSKRLMNGVQYKRCNAVHPSACHDPSACCLQLVCT
jgi:hypothetical protein